MLGVSACSGGTQTTPASNLPLNSNTDNSAVAAAPLEASQSSAKVPVYWLGKNADKSYLYREFLPLNTGDDPIETALELMTKSTPLDSDYSTPWSKASKISASLSGGKTITVDISADAFAKKLDNTTAQLALQQLVYTATAAAANSGLVDSGQSIQVTVLVDGHTDFSAFDQVKLDRPLSRDASVQAPIWIIDPQQNTAFNASPVNVTGRGLTSEGTLRWTLATIDADKRETPYQDGSTPLTANSQAGNFAFTLNPPPGNYRLTIFSIDPSKPDKQQYSDSKIFTVK